MGRHYKNTKERLRQLRRNEETAIAAYRGKRDLLRTYTEMGIDNAKTQELEGKLKRRRDNLIHRGVDVTELDSEIAC